MRFITPIVGSSRKMDEATCDALIRSPADTVTWFGYFARTVSMAEASHAAPPAATPGTSSTLKPSISLSNDRYADSDDHYLDTGETSHKEIYFDVTIPTPIDERRVAIVNHIQGYGKYADGTYWTMRMYGSRGLR